jgi:hypothetical protein
MEIDDELIDAFEILLGGVETALDLHVAMVFNVEIFPFDVILINFKLLVAKVYHFVGVPGGPDDEIGDFF